MVHKHKMLHFGENENACRHGWSLLFVIKLSDFLPWMHEASAGVCCTQTETSQQNSQATSGSHCQSGRGECCVHLESGTTCCASVWLPCMKNTSSASDSTAPNRNHIFSFASFSLKSTWCFPPLWLQGENMLCWFLVNQLNDWQKRRRLHLCLFFHELKYGRKKRNPACSFQNLPVLCFFVFARHSQLALEWMTTAALRTHTSR